jgi:hypothetical protein
MQGIYYLLSIIAVLVVLIWYIRNDKIPEGEPTRGLLAMKNPVSDADAGSLGAKEKKQGRRDKWRRPS